MYVYYLQSFRERETVLDGGPTWRSAPEDQRRNNQRPRGNDDTTPRRLNRDSYDSRSLRKGRRLSNDFNEEGRGRRGEGGHSRRTSRYSNAYSDDEGARRRGGERRSGRSQKSSRRSESYSDSDSYSRRRRRRRKGGRGGRRKGPTNIDDFDDEDWSDSESDSDSYDSSEDSWSNSDSERAHRRRLRSSASASQLPNVAWALQGGRGEKGCGEIRIKAQQDEIKKQLNHLGELQKKSGVKALPAEKQKELQGDLQKLEMLQNKRKEKPSNANVLMQLIGQQMLLSDHLRDAISIVKVKVRNHHTQYICLYFTTLA